MADNQESFASGLAFLLRKRAGARLRQCRKDYAQARIAFWKKHLQRVEKRIEALEASLPGKPKKNISRVRID